MTSRTATLCRFVVSGAVLAWVALPMAASAAGTNAGFSLATRGAPEGFDELTRPREILVDVYFGGRKVGETLALVRPGFLQFRDPQKITALIPNLTNPGDVAVTLSRDMPTNAARVCRQSNSNDCGTLAVNSVGIIFDEDNFRADVFLNPAMLNAIAAEKKAFLETPKGPPSLTSTIGLALSGSAGRSTSYNIQNRTIVGLGAARLRADTSVASGFGLVVDDLVAEAERGDLRYSAGLFWAPGLDLTGQRRIVGVGVGTQFDTRADRENLTGTPIVLFLAQPARVEFVIDGRLVGSRGYDAGNNILDTSGLPDGSYPLVLRIHESNGSVREERRFFVKTPQIAPVGQPLYFAYAGLLANTRPHSPISVSKTLYYQAGSARRLSDSLAVDVSAIGTQKKIMAEVGGHLITRVAQVRAAALVSGAGDAAALLQGVSSGNSRLAFAFDLRRVWSHNGEPLIPLPSFIAGIGSDAPTGAQIGAGSYTQASGSISYSIGTISLGVIGSLRKDEHLPSDYSIGPSLNWSIISRNGLQLSFDANAQQTRTTTAAFAGMRLIFMRHRLQLLGTAGGATVKDRSQPTASITRAIGSLSANYFYQDQDRNQVTAGAGVDRSLYSTVAHIGGDVYSRFGNGRADISDNLDGNGGLQYGITLQSAVAMSAGKIAFGARDLNDSAIIVEVGGNAADASFQVLVDNSPVGHVRSGGRFPLHLQPYRAYKVSLRPDHAAAITFDTASRVVTLYPGTVRVVRWTALTFFTAFGQAVGADGRTIAHAMVQAPHSIGETDENGYFQVDVADGDLLAFTRGSDHCKSQVSGVKPRNDFASLGKVVCQ
jgi:Mat/Ecp fimbriae outer membrane usher protein